MQLEVLQKELNNWGELILTVSEDHEFEIHLGDNLEFDTENRILYITTPEAMYMIAEDSIEFVTRHFAHKEQ